VIILLAAGAFIRFGSRSVEAPESEPAPAPVSVPETPAPAPAPTPKPKPSVPVPVSVSISNFSFGAATLTVPKGTKVTWTNNDGAPHTASSDSGAFESGSMSTGNQFSHVFSESGSFKYRCAFHPSMVSTIVVE
jgi:plastocyanin